MAVVVLGGVLIGFKAGTGLAEDGEPTNRDGLVVVEVGVASSGVRFAFKCSLGMVTEKVGVGA